MPGAHALLSASGAKRWLNCTPSVLLEAKIPEEESDYAAKGTLAHALADVELKSYLGEITSRTVSIRKNKIKKNDMYSPAMQDYIDEYVTFIAEKITEAKQACPDAIVLLEQRLDFSEYVPGGFGTGDVVIIAEPYLEVIDLKYGKGVAVDATENPQIRLYGLGALEEYSMLYDISVVKMTINQPRLESISTEELSAEVIRRWGINYVMPRAKLAAAGEGEFCAGEWCQFCKLKATCRKRAEENLAMAKYEFAEGPELAPDEISTILEKCIALAKWAGDIKDYALTQARDHGIRWDGWKLVEGRSSRSYRDKEEVIKALRVYGCSDDQTLKPTEPKGITDLTKAIGKKSFYHCLEAQGLVTKAPGKPALVPESDKRQEIGSAASAAEDFQEE